MFAFWTIARKRSASCFTRASNSAALDGMVATLPPTKRSFTSGSGVELVEDRLRRGLGRKQRGPVGGVDLSHAFLLQRRPFRIERRTLAHGDRQHADASALDMRGDRGARQHAERNIARRQRGRG